MRSATAIILLPVMLLQAAGYLFVFEIQKHEIRRAIKLQIKAGVPEAKLVLFKVFEGNSRYSFKGFEEYEFRHDGEMYDVVRHESHGDTTWYYCLADEKETQLFADLDQSVKRDMSQNPERQQRLARLLSLFGLLFFSRQDEVAVVDASEEMILSHDGFGLKIWIGPPPTPPPEA